MKFNDDGEVMKTNFVITIVICALFSAQAFAEKAVSAPVTPKCGFKEQVSINISFNSPAESFIQAKQKFDEKIQGIADYAKKQNLQKFELQSMSYNINNGYNGGIQSYQFSGNANYQMANSDDALKFAEFLTQQKLNVSVNGNSYKNGVCNELRSEPASE